MADLLPGEVSEDELEAGEVPESELEEGTPRKPDETSAEYDARVKAPAPEKGFLDKLHDLIAPETQTGAALHGGVKGASLGFADEIAGALGADEQMEKNVEEETEANRRADENEKDPAVHLSGATMKAVPEIPKLTSVSFKPADSSETKLLKAGVEQTPHDDVGASTWTEAYSKARDSMREKFDKSEAAHPKTFLAGELAGSLAVPLPGVGKAKGLAKVGKYAATGAGLGGTAALGNSTADLTQGEVGDAAIDTVIGAGTGAVAGTALGYGASKLDPVLERAASRKAYKAMDPYMATIREGLGSDVAKGKVPVSEMYQEIERLGKKALDENIIPKGPLERWTSTEGINERVVPKLREAGELKGAFVDMSQDALTKQGSATPVSIGKLATRIEQEAEAAKISGNQTLARKLLREARDLRQTVVDRAAAGFEDPAAQSLQEAEKLKTMMQGKVDYGAPLATREAGSVASRLAKEQAENAIEKGLGPEDLAQFQALKGRYGDLKTLAETSGHGAIRGFRNQSASLGDKMSANIGASAAGPGPEALAAAVATGGLNHFLHKYGGGGAARTLLNRSQTMSPTLTPATTLPPWAQLLHPKPDDEKP